MNFNRNVIKGHGLNKTAENKAFRKDVKNQIKEKVRIKKLKLFDKNKESADEE